MWRKECCVFLHSSDGLLVLWDTKVLVSAKNEIKLITASYINHRDPVEATINFNALLNLDRPSLCRDSSTAYSVRWQSQYIIYKNDCFSRWLMIVSGNIFSFWVFGCNVLSLMWFTPMFLPVCESVFVSELPFTEHSPMSEMLFLVLSTIVLVLFERKLCIN